ncbi:MAG: hypothetical protein ACE5K7_03230, partial [Phycisphaerae bacterium]
MRFVTGREEPPVSSLPRPMAVAVADKRVIACDGLWHAVVVIDPQSGSVAPLIRPGQPSPRRPVAVAVDGHGRVYVADAAGAS